MKFEGVVKAFLKEDGASGVDAVLNLLSHDDYIPKSLGFLSKSWRFMEIVKWLI